MCGTGGAALAPAGRSMATALRGDNETVERGEGQSGASREQRTLWPAGSWRALWYACVSEGGGSSSGNRGARKAEQLQVGVGGGVGGSRRRGCCYSPSQAAMGGGERGATAAPQVHWGKGVLLSPPSCNGEGGNAAPS